MSGPALVRTETTRAPWTQIPDALRQLWRACLPEHKGDVARALTTNFVGVAAAAEADALREATEKLQRRTPCRAFLLLLDGDACPREAELVATSRCHGDLRDIVLEAITLHVPPTAIDQLPGLVRPLLVNDLPVHMFWAAPWPANTTSLDGLAALCDHVVVDSLRFRSAPSELARLAERRARGERLSDLSWLRLRPWRRALAECFERFAWQRQPVAATVQHGRDATAAALLLAEWLEQRLAARVGLEGNGDTGRVPAAVRLQTGPASLELTTAKQQIVCHVTTAEHCFLPFTVPLSKGSDGDLLAAAIDMQ
ncbi:MAG: glucose-6-phosphate dehydrogenase assembly protein OpcA [Planctomycetes bacterium]|nr:glucose-6-phosphate dehydrogenase assembly protein OpcA [Planctomycetota bacterium]